MLNNTLYQITQVIDILFANGCLDNLSLIMLEK